MPDHIARKIKQVAAERKTTMRDLIVHAVEKSLDSPGSDFRLRDASSGTPDATGPDAAAVNQAIDALREPSFRR